MKIKVLSVALFSGIFFSVHAQYDGNVGINTRTPAATLHVVGKGNTPATNALKLQNSDGTDLLTITDTGSVTGSAVANLGGGGSGSNGKNALVKTTAETAGANCTTGGIKVDSGLDTDGNGTLDAGEITSTRYVCNGLAGAGYGGTSNSGHTINSGSKSFSVQAGLAYIPGQRIRFVDQTNAAHFVEGTITSYSGTTLVATIDNSGGTGTVNNWNLTVGGNLGTPGVAGIQGPTGPAGAAGATGQGVPTGGATGQVLAKVNATDFNTAWVTPSGGDPSVSTVNANTTLSGTTSQFIVASGSITITLPSAPAAGQTIYLFPDTTPTNIFVNPNGKKFRQGGIDYDTSKLSDFGVSVNSTSGLTLIYNGVKWYPVSL